MVSYKCARCKQTVEIDTNVRCPYCGQKLPTCGMANMKKRPDCGKELP